MFYLFSFGALNIRKCVCVFFFLLLLSGKTIFDI